MWNTVLGIIDAVSALKQSHLTRPFKTNAYKTITKGISRNILNNPQCPQTTLFSS